MADVYDAQGEARRIGEEIRRARVLAKRTQAGVAAALGYHQSKLSRLEQGRGTADSQVVRAVAQELGIPLAVLGLAALPDATATTSESETEDMHRRTFLAASVAALATPAPPMLGHHMLVQALLPDPTPSLERDGDAVDVLAARISAVRSLFSTCDYTELQQVLPDLITDLRQAAPASTEATALLATAYQTAVSLLLKLGDHGHAWLAVGRAMAEAERCGDPIILASSVRVHAHLLARERHTSQAVTLVRHTADQLTGAYDQRSPRYLAALGLLLLRGVTAASSGGDRSATKDFLTEAHDVARYVSLDRPDAWANFSPTNVSLHAVSAANALGDAGIALETAGPLMRRHIPAPERRTALWIETARAYSQQGRLADGYQALRIAESCAAQDVRRPAVRELVADMAARDRHRTLPELHHFSRQLGASA
jgi:transcriptional regulator with XRE-family HTH domain